MKYQVMSDLTTEEYSALKADIAENGVLVAIEFDENGNVLDGHHRLKACKELGIIDYPKLIKTGMSESEKFDYAKRINFIRRHLSSEQKRQYIREQLIRTPEISDRQIAAGLGVSNKTVSITREEMELSGQVCKLHTSIGADGKEYPRNPYQPVQGVDYETSEEYFERFPSEIPHVTHNSGCNEWYTPEDIISAVREVLGNIDTDPASSDIANSVVGASTYYTIHDDGLFKDWHGNVFMNPPYSTDLIPKFISKLFEQLNDGNIDSAIVLVNNATETNWFFMLISMASAVCFPKGRVKYWNEKGTGVTPLQGQAIVYIGNEHNKFIKRFKRLGWCGVVK